MRSKMREQRVIHLIHEEFSSTCNIPLSLATIEGVISNIELKIHPFFLQPFVEKGEYL